MALEWKTIPYSDEVAPTVHTHVEADITDLSHDAVSLQGNQISDEMPSDGAVLVWNETLNVWEPGMGGGGAATLDDLTDVALGTPQTGHVLTFNETYWESAFPPGTTTLDSLTDVTADMAQQGDVLTFDQGGWTATAPPTDADTLDGEHASAFADASHIHALYELSEVTLGTPATGDVLTYSNNQWRNIQPSTDADTLDGEHASAFADATHSHAGTDITSAVANATDADTLDGEHASAFADAAHGHALDDLTDVTLGTPATGHVLTYDTDHWESAAPASHSHAGTDITSAVANATDADTLDGEHASAFADAAHAHVSDYAPITHAHAGGDITSAVANATDADTLDGEHASAFADAVHGHALDDLTDVTLGTPATGHVLTYDTDHWESAAPAVGAAALDDLTDVTLGTPQTGHVLTYDTDHWESAAPAAPATHTHAEADITDLSHNATSIQGYGVSSAAPSDGDTLVWNELAAKWTPGESVGSGGGGTLTSLLDVGITATPDDNQVLAFKTGAGQWRAMSLPAAPSTARVREFDFQAEYPGAIIDPATLGDGLLEAFADAGHNAYEWTVISAAEQSAYLYLRWRLPPGFVSFAGGLKVTSKVSNVAKNCGVEVLGLYDATGANAIAYITFKNADWTEDNINLVAGTFAAGDTVLAKLRIFGQDTSVAYLAGIRIQYNGD